MLNPWVRVLMWAVVALFVLLFFTIMNTASASTLKIENGVATMSEADFKKLTEYLNGLESSLNRTAEKSIMWQGMYEDARACVFKSAKDGLPTTPCFNLTNEQKAMTGHHTYPSVTLD